MITAKVMFVFISLAFLSSSAFSYSPEKAGFSIKFKQEVSSFRVMSLFVLPEEVVEIEMLDPGKSVYDFKTSSGTAVPRAANRWQWTAPKEKGLYPSEISIRGTGDTVTLNIFVMVPFHEVQNGHLNGYRIGEYPRLPFKQLAIYKPPQGFIEVTEANQDTLLSPHFRLRQFLCKQNSAFPKYVVLRERLLLKLELLLERVNEAGFHAETFNVLSGYRTPYYNKAIGNVNYSRHIYGGAADIFIDENPRDDMMDDLNRDGRVDYRDAGVLYDIVDGIYGQPWYIPHVGGLGRYRKTASHGPYVHVDIRGFHARWGT